MPTKLNVATPTETDNDGTPTGYGTLTGQDTGKVAGSAAEERGTLFDVQKDTDQVIKMGGGDDLFVFGPNDPKVDLNGLVFMGAGDDDQVWMNHRVEDYVFTLRSDGGIKIQFTAEEDGKGDAITFYEAETFTFRNVDPGTGVNYESVSYTYEDLAALIAGASPTPV